MYDISYDCTSIKPIKELGLSRDNGRLIYCELEFENEHGIKLKTTNAVVLVLGDNADIVKYPENVLDTWSEEFQRLCDEGPSYSINNGEEVAEWLHTKTEIKPDHNPKRIQYVLCDNNDDPQMWIHQDDMEDPVIADTLEDLISTAADWLDANEDYVFEMLEAQQYKILREEITTNELSDQEQAQLKEIKLKLHEGEWQ